MATRRQTQTVRISADGFFGGVSVHTPYPLEEAEFLKVTKVTSFVPIWAHTFFTGTAVFFITLLAKWLEWKYWSGDDSPYPISRTEEITLVILVILAAVFELANSVMPSDKRDTLKKIAKHFSDNKPKAAGLDHE